MEHSNFIEELRTEAVASLDTVIHNEETEEIPVIEVDMTSYSNYEPSRFPSVENLRTTLPTNSESLLISETTSRFSSAEWFDNIAKKDILIGGAGGIGSMAAFMLSRVHPSTITIYDDDIVDATNLAGQFYSSSDIGQSKVQALNTLLHRMSSYYSMFSYNRKFTESSLSQNIMIGCFDNMEARKLFFNKWLSGVRVSSTPKTCLFIDGRLSAEEFQVLCMTGDDSYHIQMYKDKWLFSDAEADATVCSYKQTSFMSNMIGSIITNLVVNFCANEVNPIFPRDLPFLTEYTAETMYFKTEN